MVTLPLPGPALLDPADLDVRLRSCFREALGDVGPDTFAAARAAVRRRAQALRRRRRRVRHALGSTTLAAGLTAGSVQVWLDGRTGGAAPTAAAGEGAAPGATSVVTSTATTAPVPDPPDAPLAPAPPPTASWTWDPGLPGDREAADPGALYAEGDYHVYTTSAVHCVDGDCRAYQVPRFTSTDLAEPGRFAGDAMPERPAWVDVDHPAIWAPSAARVGDRYVLWFAATSGRPRDRGMKCLGAAVAATPAGPFVPQDDPLHCTPGYWSIDPSPVADGDGWVLLWRQDDAAHVTGSIVGAPLRPDGLGLAGPPTTLLVGERAWEEGYPDGRPGIGPIENPAMARHPDTGELLLTWSANRWETRDYATGLAVCDGPLGPCRRISDTMPWLRTSADPGFASSAQLGGAGGLSFTSGPDGTLYAVLHGYRGRGDASTAPRVAWAYRVEAAGPGSYRLVDVGNHPAAAAVNES